MPGCEVRTLTVARAPVAGPERLAATRGRAGRRLVAAVNDADPATDVLAGGGAGC